MQQVNTCKLGSTAMPQFHLRHRLKIETGRIGGNYNWDC